ncbi:hypothetical protein BXZ70DRAFT_989265 [Cristinia sonorae]|uniref:Cupredoxin n=1 Tax=Cristinia sonorae TaxID=1940300 RepID=A0A8K0XPE8_9AGAR|nr:hypothetical protein BXZ70DRAFT_989265 [Cristinia sonorae]
MILHGPLQNFLSTLVTLYLSFFAVCGAAHNTFNVTVGGLTNGTSPIIAFNPTFLSVQPGDEVIFLFSQGNHTVSQSTFEKPCELQDGGFDTGFVPVADTNTRGPFPAVRFVVQDSNPLWIFCRQTQHCANGMVFALNPPNATMFQAFLNKTQDYKSTTINDPPSSVVPAFGIQSGFTGDGVAVQATATVTTPGGNKVITYESYPGSAAPTSLASSDHLVLIGGSNELTFAPAHITAQPGDTITFQFTRGNHSVVQSSFEHPCQSLTKTSMSGETGFNSGFIPLGESGTSSVNFTIQVNDTNPIFAFCSQWQPFSHCHSGMVFAANTIESGSLNFGAFQRNALQLDSTSSLTITAPTATITVYTSSEKNGAEYGLFFFLIPCILSTLALFI